MWTAVKVDKNNASMPTRENNTEELNRKKSRQRTDLQLLESTSEKPPWNWQLY